MLRFNRQSFIFNYVKGIHSSKQRLKLIQYFKSKIGPCGLLFFLKKDKKNHSNSRLEQKWKEDFDS